VINLDVVTRHYGLVTCRYTIILMLPRVTQHITLTSMLRMQVVPWCTGATGSRRFVNSAARRQLLGATEWKQ